MKKIFPKYTDPADEFRKSCDRAYMYDRDENGQLWRYRVNQVFMTRYRAEDEITDDVMCVDASDYFYD